MAGIGSITVDRPPMSSRIVQRIVISDEANLIVLYRGKEYDLEKIINYLMERIELEKYEIKEKND